MTGFLDIECYEFQNGCFDEAYSFLKGAGNKYFEAVALFAGTIEENHAIINKVIFPLQESSRSKHGLMYTVRGDELHRINTWLYENKLKLIAQIHSHPREAYHSDTDNEFPIVSTVGSLSIVVPNFAQASINHLNWAYYMLQSETKWQELNQADINQLIKII